MVAYHELFMLITDAKPSFYDVTARVKEIVSRSGVRDGIAVIYSQHTTCSVIIQEESHDETYAGTKFLLQDLLDVFEKVAPECRKEGQYMHPGPRHIEYVTKDLGELPTWSLNTDAHLRSCMMGRSETVPLVAGELQLGEFGQIYFIDFDGTRARERFVRVQVIGE
jgi:secondary thiamine-phosphate synthase enzyme